MKERWREAPMPATLEDALREIQTLRDILYRERQVLAKNIVRREEENRANRGNMKALREENAELRNENTRLNRDLVRLHAQLTGPTP